MLSPPFNSTESLRKPTGVRFSEFSSLIIFHSPPRNRQDNLFSYQPSTDEYKCDIVNNAIIMRSAGVDSTIERLVCAVATANCAFVKNIVALPEEARGIEQYISCSVLHMIMHRRSQAISAVLEEQEIQRELGVIDAVRLAQVSKKHTEFSRTWAFAIANTGEMPWLSQGQNGMSKMLEIILMHDFELECGVVFYIFEVVVIFYSCIECRWYMQLFDCLIFISFIDMAICFVLITHKLNELCTSLFR